MNAELVGYLLELLESPLTKCDKPSATKAIIAESLKAMARDLANGEKVGLKPRLWSPVWKCGHSNHTIVCASFSSDH